MSTLPIFHNKIFDFIMFYYENMERRHLILLQSGYTMEDRG